MPVSQATAALLVGISSFGAQGTNAHALLAGSGAAAVISAWSAGLPPAWRRSRCYVAPPAQHLLTSCLLRKRSRGGAMAFDSSLSAPRLAYLWQYSLHGRAFLSTSAVLSMAASLLPLLGAVADGEDPVSAASVAAVVEAAMVAPAMLPQAAAARVAAAVARVKLAGTSGAVEVALADQQLLAAKFAASPEAARADGGGATPVPTPRAAAVRAQLVGRVPASDSTAPASVVAEAAPLAPAEVSGYALHPALLDACLGQAASVADAAAAPFPWVRSVAALLVGSSSPTGGSVAAVYQPADSWQAGSGSLAAQAAHIAAATLLGVVLGDQDMPPASPGPSSMPLSARAGQLGGPLAGGEEEEAPGVPADHPLLQMPEGERLLHLQAQVRYCCPTTTLPGWKQPCMRRLAHALLVVPSVHSTCRPSPASALLNLQVMSEVRAMLGRAVHPDEPLMAAGLDSRGGMELRRTLAGSLGLQVTGSTPPVHPCSHICHSPCLLDCAACSLSPHQTPGGLVSHISQCSSPSPSCTITSLWARW